MSSRSLLRVLADHGLGDRDVLSEARSRMPAWRLLETTSSLAEVGYLSGYSDPPHFTRDFRLRVGATPAQLSNRFQSCQPGKVLSKDQ